MSTRVKQTNKQTEKRRNVLSKEMKRTWRKERGYIVFQFVYFFFLCFRCFFIIITVMRINKGTCAVRRRNYFVLFLRKKLEKNSEKNPTNNRSNKIELNQKFFINVCYVLFFLCFAS
jgi:hypothetical protein